MIAPLRERLRAALAGLRESVLTRLDGLAPRERLLLGGALSVSTVLILWLGIWEPLAERQASLRSNLERTRREATEIGELVRRHGELTRDVDALENRASRSDTSLFARLEGVAVPVVGRDRITAMNPSRHNVDDRFEEEIVDLRLEGVSMERVLRLLHAIELGDDPVHVARLALKRQYKDPTALDATLLVSRLAPVSK